MPTAPPLDNFDTFATNSKKAAHKQNLKNPKSYEPTRHPTNPTTIRPPAIRVTEAPLPTKISLKEYLKSKGKFSLQPQGNNNVADKKRPKTKYDTDTIIYPTTTYRPQTFEPTSQVAQNFAAALQKGQRKSKAKSNAIQTTRTTQKTTRRPFGVKDSKSKRIKKKRKGKKKVRKVKRKRVFFDKLRKSNKKHQQKLRALAQKEAAEQVAAKEKKNLSFESSASRPQFNFAQRPPEPNRNSDIFLDDSALLAKEDRKRKAQALHHPLLFNAVKPTSNYNAPGHYAGYAGFSHHPTTPAPPPAPKIKALASPYEYKAPTPFVHPVTPEPTYGAPLAPVTPSPVTPKPAYGPPPVPVTPKPAYGPPPVPVTPKPAYGPPEPLPILTPEPAYGPPPTPKPVYHHPIPHQPPVTPQPAYGSPKPYHQVTPKPAYKPPKVVTPKYKPLLSPTYDPLPLPHKVKPLLTNHIEPTPYHEPDPYTTGEAYHSDDYYDEYIAVRQIID